MRRVLTRFFKILVVTTGVLALLTYVGAEVYFNVSSNAVMWSVRTSGEGVRIKMADGEWVALTPEEPLRLAEALRERYREEGFVWSSLRVERPARRLGRLAQKVFGAEVNVIEISPTQFRFQTSFLDGFESTTAKERLGAERFRFVVTANFQYPSGKPMGWVWHEGLMVNRETLDWSGVFFVKDGQPYFGPKSLLTEVTGVMTEGAQVYPSVMKDHTVFSYVNTAPDRFFNGKEITYRSLAGVRKDGTVVFVLSGDGGVLSVGEVALIAKNLNVQHATLLDGGKALQYSIDTEDGPRHFQAYNTRLPFTSEKLKPQRSPVFIGVKRHLPLIRTGALPPPADPS